MNFDLLKMIFQLICALGITLGLMFLIYKILGTKVVNINNNKYVKVLERVQITKDNAILIVQVGQKGFVLASSAKHVEKLLELSEDEIKQIEENKANNNKEVLELYNKYISLSKKSFFSLANKIGLKEDRDEKK